MSTDNTISRIDPSAATLSPTNKAEPSAARAKSEPSDSMIADDDTLQLTSNTKRLQEIEKLVPDAHDENSQRLKEVSKVINSDNWTPDLVAMAGKMMAADALWKDI